MSSNLNTLSAIYFLVVASILLGLAGWITKQRVQGRNDMFSKLFSYFDDSLPKDFLKEENPKRNFSAARIFPKSYLKSTKIKLSKAGLAGDEDLAKLIKQKFIFMFVFFGLGMLYFASSANYFMIVLVGLFGFFLPDLLLTNKIQKRSQSIAQALPDAVEMLTMCVEAGLSFQQSLKRVSENQDTVIATEFARIMSEIQIGETRSQALANMAERLNHHDVSKFVSAMLQVDKLGIPISSVLREQVNELRSRSRMRAREQAQKVPVKILGPVMVCFLPCTLIIVLGPVLLQFFN